MTTQDNVKYLIVVKIATCMHVSLPFITSTLYFYTVSTMGFGHSNVASRTVSLNWQVSQLCVCA